jgi:hypothetical protein
MNSSSEMEQVVIENRPSVTCYYMFDKFASFWIVIQNYFNGGHTMFS